MRAQILSSLLYAILNAIVMATFGLNSITLTTIIVSIVVIVPLVGGRQHWCHRLWWLA
jgi:predicted PurR-regulated permease PerM